MARKQKDKLNRSLGFFSLTNLVIANMIGAGIFTTSGLLMGDVGNPWLMLLLWGIGGVLALCGALSYGELGAAMPQAGGEYNFLSKLFHPLHGFLSGWASFIAGFSAPIAASAIGFSAYFFRAFPDLGSSLGLSMDINKKLVSIFVILLFSGVHLRGIKFGAKVQNYLTLFKVLLVIGLLVIGFLWGKGDLSHFTSQVETSSDFGSWKTAGLSLMWIMFAYSGWNASVYVGSEIKDPKKNLARSLILGTLIVTLLYVLLNILFVYAVSPTDMKGVIAIGGLAVNNLFGSSTDTIISLLISFALFSSLSAFIIIGPRVYYAMARDGYFFKCLAQVHPVFKVPSNAILTQASVSIILVLSGTFDQILTYMGFALGIFPILTVFGLFKLRKSGHSVLKLPGYPWVQVFYILISLSILILAFLERPKESSIALLSLMAGIPIFMVFQYLQNHTNSKVSGNRSED
ncbi:APC family permease [Ulvibacterium sp.]|uniref:APC family permease n=1 Tax=Ulvibacterium sp. TaxID=2665914 RepID=UPI002627088B|nr:amino acid permease [Ulvibacterium sp.]